MSDYSDYYSSRDPSREATPVRRHHRHHHHHHVRAPEPQRMLYGRNTIVYNFVYLVSIGVQLLVMMSVGRDHQVPTIHIPKAHEQKLAHFLNLVVERFPKFSFLSLFLPWSSVLAVSFLVANTFDILYCASGCVAPSILVSLLMLFDEATLSIVRKNPSFAIQLSLISVSLGCAYKLPFNSVFSITWILDIFVGSCAAIIASFIRLESLALALPLMAQATVSLVSQGHRSFWRRIISTIFASMLLLVVCGVSVFVVFCTWVIFGLPRFELWPVESELLIAEYLTNPHNVAVLALIPLAFCFLKFSSVSGLWVLAMSAATIATLMSPITCVVDDVLVRTVLATYALLLTCGFVLCDENIAHFTTPLLAVVLSAVVYFYVYPIQT